MGKVMTSIDFVNKAKKIATNYKTLYVLGCFGAPMTASNKKRYENNNSYNKKRASMINKATTDTFGFDCVCLIKGILWGWNGNVKANYGGAKYESNGVPDVDESVMINKYCTNVSTNFKNIEVGEVVWLKGHIGIYIGNGLAVECTPKWENKVQITAVKNIGTKAGYNARTWTKHGKLVFIDYKEPTPKPTPEPINSFLPSKGYWGYGDKDIRVGKIASFMRKTFPAYTNNKALGNYYGKYLQASIKEFQKRTGLIADGKVGSKTLAKLKQYGFKE